MRVLILFKQITKIADQFSDYKFIMPVANRYKNLSNTVRKNMILVDYIPDLRNNTIMCSIYKLCGGYNATMEILKSTFLQFLFLDKMDKN